MGMVSQYDGLVHGHARSRALAYRGFGYAVCVALGLTSLWQNNAVAQDPPLSQYQATVLTRGLVNPTSFAFRPDGRIYITRKNGTIRLLNPATGDTSTVGVLPAANLREDGLHSLVLDPDFHTTPYVYVLFSERTLTDTGLVVARYLTDVTTGALLTGSRATLLRIPFTLNSSPAEHNTGSLSFGPDGNLFIALADNTQNIFSGTGAGFAPRDPARPLYDAQRSAANTNDLRGKILRIKPEANGTYSIPAGNLRDSISHPVFNPTWKSAQDTIAKVRPEIYTMGLRHPFRISVDAQTGWVFWAEPGPNATVDNATQGPRGYEVVSMAKGPGNYGWPYCRANPSVIQKPSSITGPFCYTHYNYSNATGGAMYNPDSLRNTSVNNTGIVNLPPMKPSQVWYPYQAAGATPTAFPIFGGCPNNGSGCNTAVIGPVYNHDPTQGSARLPSVFNRHVFIIEWVRNHILVAPIDSMGNIGTLRTFRSARDSVTNGPMEVRIGPDGALYFLNWVNSTTSTTQYAYPNNTGNGTLVRFAYTGAHVGLGGLAAKARHGHTQSDRLFAAVPGAVFVWPEGGVQADFYALTGEKLWSIRRGDGTLAREVAVPDQVRGVVRLRLR
jgi:cytochrome c